MALDLKKMQRDLDEMLKNETPESLNAWLEEHRVKGKVADGFRLTALSNKEIDELRNNAYSYLI